MASAAPARTASSSFTSVVVALARRPLGLITALDADALVMLALVLGLGISHGVNMVHFPPLNRFNDEGVYAESAWAVLHGHIAPYTFDYGHVPAGWFLIALWMALTGGVHTFGLAIDSGRAMTLVLDLVVVALLFRVARKLGCGIPAAAFAAGLMVISPLAIYYQRLLLIDNLMLFWALISLDLLLDAHGRLSRLALSGLFLGLAALTKETAVVLAPGMLLLALRQMRPHQGPFGFLSWIFPMAVVVSWYPLFAALKGELLPAGHTLHFWFMTLSTGTHHVSLLDAIGWQAGRSGGGFLNMQNSFWFLVRTAWLHEDAFLFAGGSLLALVNLIRGVRNRIALACSLLVIVPMLYLARGGVVFHFYILAALPFLCLNFALALEPLLARLPRRLAALGVPAALLLLGWGYVRAGTLMPLYQNQSDAPEWQAVSWIRAHVPSQSLIIADDTLWADLHDPGPNGKAFPNLESHFKVALDPEVTQGIFHNDWKLTDYLIVSPGMEDDMKTSNDTIGLTALQHSHLVQRWTADQTWVEVWKVDKAGPTEASLLSASDGYLKQHFAGSGAFAEHDGRVTSESQAYAMLRAVWSKDRRGFEQAWDWTQQHLQRPDGLLAWRWQGGSVTDPHSASDADSDAALALLMAGQQWSDQAWLDAGKAMVGAIWQQDVVQIHGRLYLAAGDWATTEAGAVPFNPSYFSPYAYHVFQEVDHAHSWLALVDSGYDVLFAASQSDLGSASSAGLPPDWLGIDRNTGQLVALPASDNLPTSYGYDAARTYWRIALDQRWTGDGRAGAYLRQAGFLHDEVSRQGGVSAVYGHDGSIVEAGPSAVADAGVVSALLTLDPAAANVIYDKKIVGAAQLAKGGAYWDNPNDLYGQEWRWFTVALYGNALPDIWHGAQ